MLGFRDNISPLLPIDFVYCMKDIVYIGSLLFALILVSCEKWVAPFPDNQVAEVLLRIIRTAWICKYRFTNIGLCFHDGSFHWCQWKFPCFLPYLRLEFPVWAEISEQRKENLESRYGCWRDEYFQIMNFCGPNSCSLLLFRQYFVYLQPIMAYEQLPQSPGWCKRFG